MSYLLTRIRIHVTIRDMKKQPRSYRQEARAEKTETTAQDIVQAMVDQVRSVRRLSDITLEDIAAKSGVTVRTILRRFGSRDGLLEAAFEKLRVEIEGQRPETKPGDTHAGLGPCWRSTS